MPDQMPLLRFKHLNRGLFSDYYLNEIAPTLAEWQSPTLFAEARNLRDDLRTLLAGVRPDALDEAQIEEQWVKPALEKLGHHWSVQVKIRYRDHGYRKPDYVFTATPEEARGLTNEIYEPKQLAHALAVGDAKRWGVNLDQTSASDQRNPSQQIDEYLRYSELPWGILTDGQFWRLYERSSSKDNAYYAVDLPALLKAGSVEDFYYFYLFFRQEAFVKEGWLEQVLQGSVQHAERLSEQLEDEVYDALELIAQGFLKYRRNRLQPKPATLKTIYEQSLVLLYRLLFIFYAESRDVLPMSDHENYAKYGSLQALIYQALTFIMEGDHAYRRRVDEAGTYEQLGALFYAIDAGSAEFDVPAYNGRLFSEDEHPFLAEKRIGEAFLLPALDKLARTDRKGVREGKARRVLVDYRDLDVRHLGAIYEKLLEYELDVAAEPLALKDGKYVPAQEDDEVKKKPGEVYLRTGNNERKITGSYYTPDYIVGFIVEQTLEPLLEEITPRYAELDAEGHWQVHDPDGLRRAILNLNILDPATGSGHFLVEAVAHVAKWLRGLGLHPDDLAADEDELIYWKRQVATSCIYGVDMNPLAVELARLSLWLATAVRDKPLTFFDHHIKVGNSLVGARAGQIMATLPLADAADKGGQDENQLPLFEEAAFGETVSEAIGSITFIETVEIESVAEVKQQEQQYDLFRRDTAIVEMLADAWTARHFGLAVTQDDWTQVWRALMKGEAPTPAAVSLLHQANILAEQHRFFHWDLRFPEVFFDAEGKPLPNAGFDAVIGNPPYVRQERIQPYKPYFATNYAVHQGTADLFLYFYEQALNLVKPGRRMGYITSGTYMNSNSAAEFRRYIQANAGFEAVVNFGENQPFKGAEMVYPTMAVLRKGQPKPTFRSLFVEDVYRRDELGEAIQALPMVETSSEVTALDEWRFQSVELTRLFKKITEGYQALGRFVGGRIYSGIKTGLNDAFVIDGTTRERLIKEHSASLEIIKPLQRGQDLRPWYQAPSELYLLFTRHGINIDAYPAIKKHLEGLRNRLEPRPETWDARTHGNWQGRKPGTYAWYEIQDQIAYYEEFEKTKIVWPDIAKLPRVSLCERGYLSNTAFMIPSVNYSLLALLQSRPLWFAISQIAQPLRLRAGLWQYRVIPQFVERLPIPELSAAQDSTLAELAEQITQLARERYQLHEGVRHRLASDLGKGGRLNEKLESWWGLEFPELRAEVKKAFKNEIPVSERGDWERYLADQQAKHEAATGQIVALERRLNGVVYEAFKLTAEEISLIERSTRYPYGAV